MPTTGRDKYARQSLGGNLQTRIKKARVLMVGAGGIGCELLKNLVLTGFGEIHLVDLDTIDLSNLNRQFLFRNEHIKKSKALVAKESAGRFNPNVKIEAYHDNIKDPKFSVAWFQTFEVVFNALDNLDARRHVNKMCLAADVPLIESGTTGFLGQVQPIRKGKSQCYDCTPKEAPKSFAVCTIRSTPSQPIHCIVWAKAYLFNEIFGTSEDDAPEIDKTEDSGNKEEIGNLAKEATALKRIRGAMGSEEFPRLVFEKVFKEDIERLLSMEDMWKARTKPVALDYDSLSGEALGVGSAVAKKDQAEWTPAENFAVFLDSLRRLSSRVEETKAAQATGNSPPVLTFDKDDEDTMDFVAASANLRSLVFHMERKSKFDIKQMAGNIIPAIATTNAMTASLCVLQAFKVMRGELHKAKMVFLAPNGTERRLTAETLSSPNPDCPVCSVAQTTVEVDLARATLNDLVEGLLRLELKYGEEFSVNSGSSILYDPDEDINLSKTLTELDLQNDSFLTVIDESQENARVNLVLNIVGKDLNKGDKPYHLDKKIDIPIAPPKKPTEPETNGHPHPVTNGNGVSNGAANGATNGTRKRTADEAGLEDELIKKKGKVAAKPDEDDIVLIEDSNEGAIVIDD
ncbi:ubiquitin-activating enzyme E1 3 [Massarina eburnea CBS 473.64]|uniref:Ubiquitin-activating enzyme E1-like n=1 Tax=Massarina eburnea CBS 473.64 TaxID=1395130 RepID=A0A6A6RRC3_9PLEO|nr:ubiquitin-activating enzyme E1 3 [Massarina eburnea CBS 473.64]